MNIAVCISSVPDTTSKINFIENNTKFDKNGIQLIINPYDEFGLTKAIMLKESHNAKITIITVGDTMVEPVMRKALAIGADEAIRIDAVPKDSYSTAKEIAAYLIKNPVDLIIAGKESTDYNTGAVPAMIAELMNLSFVNACIGLEIDGNDVKMKRETEDGKETVSAQLPVIIGGQKGLVEESELKIPNMRGIMQSRTKPLTVINPVSETEIVKTTCYSKPPKKASCKMIESDNLSELINLLQNEAKVI